MIKRRLPRLLEEILKVYKEKVLALI